MGPRRLLRPARSPGPVLPVGTAAARAAALAAAVAVGACGSAAAPATTPSTIVVVRPAVKGTPVAATTTAPAPIDLRLVLPLVGPSTAAEVSYTTERNVTVLRGAVTPAATTVYMLDDLGGRIVVNPAGDGAFAVRAKLHPGLNSFRFTAARLGAASRSAAMLVTWQGPAADALRRKMAADPGRYMPAASAGLNRSLASLGDPAAALRIARGASRVTFSVSPITASAPPAAGGPGRWLGGFELTEYYPALEAWFSGAAVAAPGLSGPHRIDWLYSAHGLSMEGDGIGLDGRQYHVAGLGSGGWLTASGGGTARFGNGADAPFWRTGGFWRSDTGALTYPLGGGGWSAGTGVRYVPPPAGISFAPGPSRPLSYLRSVAVDPRLIPMGSHIYIPSYAGVNGGWFEAADTGGAIVGRHIDVFRPPPANPNDGGNFATGQRVYIVPPGAPLP